MRPRHLVIRNYVDTATFLTKRKRKSLNARIEELDLKSPVQYLTLLPDELIKAGLPNFAAAVRA
jgi:hypothetical protein